MYIEVPHDGARLPFKRKVAVRYPSAAYDFLMTACESRAERGLRVRIAANHPTKELWLEARNTSALDTALSLLPRSYRRF